MIISKNLFAKVSLFVFSTFIAGLFLTSVCFGQLPGELDPAFFAGRTTTKISSINDYAFATAIQTDGKIVVAGHICDGSNCDFAVARYNTDGTLDKSFGTNGKVVTPIGSGNDYVSAVVIQPDDKIVVGGSSENAVGSHDFALVRYNSNGMLDSSFDGDGKLTTNISGYDSISSLVIKSSKIIAAGSSNGGGNFDFAVVRYNLSNGSLDNTFSGDGKVTFPIGAGDDLGTAAAVQLNDRIVVAGYSSNGANHDFALARINADGSLDDTLNGTGKVTTPIGLGNDFGQAIAILPDNRIIVAGYMATPAAGENFAVVRYNVFGVLDTSFDGDGKLTTDLNGYDDNARSVAVQPDGKIVIVGETSIYGGGFHQFGVVRYGTDGTLDTTFDTDGKLNTQFHLDSGNYANAVALQTDGKIVVAGHADGDFAVARYNPNGSLDGTFGNRVFTGFDDGDAQAVAVATAPDGKIVVAGFNYNGTDRDFAVARYNTDGTLDSTFSSNGTVTTAFGAGIDDLRAVAVQTDGKIVVAGYSLVAGTNSFALARFNLNGTLDNTFGGGSGKMVTAMGSGSSVAYAMAIQADGKIVLAGSASQNGSVDFALARYAPNGSLDPGFGTGGRVMTAVGTNADSIRAVAIQTDGKIIVAGEAYNGGANRDFALARYNADGSLDANFDNDGKTLVEMGSLNDTASSLAIQPNGKIVVGGYGTFPDWNFELACFNSDGTLDTNFDDDGRVTTDFIAGNADFLNSFALQTDGKIIAAGTTSLPFGAGTSAAFARYNADGSLDANFDFSAFNAPAENKESSSSTDQAGDGKIVIAISGGNDNINDIAVQPNGKIIAVGYGKNGASDDFQMIRLNGSPIAPTASTATISGRVTMGKGKAVNRAVVSITDSTGNTRTTLTNPFGYYRFEDVEAGQTYILNAASKRYQFSAQVVLVNEDMENLDFSGDFVFPN